MENIGTHTPVHPVIAMLPAMDERERAQLRKSIASSGVQNPIIVHEGTIVDGAQRRDGAIAIGATVPARSMPEGQDPIDCALAQNLTRRQLTPGQRAMFIADVAQWNETQQRQRGRATGSKRSPKGTGWRRAVLLWQSGSRWAASHRSQTQ